MARCFILFDEYENYKIREINPKVNDKGLLRKIEMSVFVIKKAIQA